MSTRRYLTLITVLLMTLWSIQGLLRNRTSAQSPGNREFELIVGEAVVAKNFSLGATDLSYSEFNNRIFLSIGSLADRYGNSLLRINPDSGEIEGQTFAGSEPTKVASSRDGRTIYLYLNGSASLARFDAESGIVTKRFPIGIESGGRLYADDIAVSPDDPNIVAVGRLKRGLSPPEAGVAIFDDGVQLPNIARAGGRGSSYLTFGDSGSVLFGNDWRDGNSRISVDTSGATVAQTLGGVSGSRLKHGGGRLVDSGGGVWDAASGASLGTIPNMYRSAFEIDYSNRRIFVVRFDGLRYTISAYDFNSLALVGTAMFEARSGYPTYLKRWGSNGLAFTTDSGNLLVVNTTLIPNGDPLPSPTVSPTATPSVSPTIRTSYRTLPVRVNSLGTSPADGSIFATVPSSDPMYGNRIFKFVGNDPEIGESGYAGSEPGKISFSPDGSISYVIAQGSRSVRKIRTSDLTTETEFRVGNDSGPVRPISVAVSPDSVDTVAVTRYASGLLPTTVYDNGVPRPKTDGSALLVAYSDTASIFYGSSEAELMRISVRGSGTSIVNRFPFASGYRLVRAEGKLYSTTGAVIDPDTGNLVGSFNVGGLMPNVTLTDMVVDTTKRRAFFLGVAFNECFVGGFDIDRFTPVGTFRFRCTSSEVSLARWGSDGLMIGRNSEPLLVLRSTLVDPDSTVVPSTPTPTATPLPPQSAPAIVRSLQLATSDLVHNPVDGRIYASVPSDSGDSYANQICAIDPAQRAVVSSYTIGTEPKLLALSDDSTFLWVSLEGGLAMRSLNVESGSRGSRVPISILYRPLSDIEVFPGTTDRVVVSDGVWARAYEGGVLLPDYPRGVGNNFGARMGPMEFDSTGSVLYGYDSATTGVSLVLSSPVPTGLTLVSETRGMMNGADFIMSGDRIVTTGGLVVDPSNLSWLGRFDVSARSVAVDDSLGRAYFLTNSSIEVFDVQTYSKLGTILFENPAGSADDLVLVPGGRLAFRVTNQNGRFVKFVESRLIDPNSDLPSGVEFAATQLDVNESVRTVQVAVRRSGSMDSYAVAELDVVSGTAVNGEDFDVAPRPVSFGPGESVAIVEISVHDDGVWEGVESFRLRLRDPAGAVILDNSEVEIRIADSGQVPVIRGYFTSVLEGGPGESASLDFEVLLSRPSTFPATIDYVASAGSAQAGIDFLPVSGTLVFSPGETRKVISVTVLADEITEPNESVWLRFSNPTNASLQTMNVSGLILDRSFADTIRRPFDFDGDGATDLSMYRPSSNTWHIYGSSGTPVRNLTFGLRSDSIVAAEYSGDVKTDVAVFRNETGEWFMLRSQDSTVFGTKFGLPGDIPVGADFDGDRVADFAVFRPDNNTWYVKGTVSGDRVLRFGADGDVPAVADYDGDEKVDIGLWRASSGEWWILRSSDGAAEVRTFGSSGSVAVPGDYTGDGIADLALFSAADGSFRIKRSDNGAVDTYSFPDAAFPAPGDYDADGIMDPGACRYGGYLVWNYYGSRFGYQYVNYVGALGDIPLPSTAFH